MNPIFISLIVLMSVAALVGTMFVGRDVNKTISKYEKEGDKGEAQLTEKPNPKQNSSLIILSSIYGVTFLTLWLLRFSFCNLAHNTVRLLFCLRLVTVNPHLLIPFQYLLTSLHSNTLCYSDRRFIVDVY